VASIEKWSDEVECGGRLGTSKGEATCQARVEERGLTDRVQQRQGRNVGSTADIGVLRWTVVAFGRTLHTGGARMSLANQGLEKNGMRRGPHR
jgi:hypothetical protein